MVFAEEFVFSQGSLQDYVACRRRFQLKYLRQQVWPALEVEPALVHELHSIKGQQFHGIVERYYLIRQYASETEARQFVEASITDDSIRSWWQAFLDEPPLNIPDEVVLPETRLTIEVGQHRLVAVFDLLAIERNQRIVIVDWKTSHRRPTRETLAMSLQTRVYPYVVTQGAADLFGGEVDPARLTMVYWYANFPAEPHVYHYSAAQYQLDRAYLLELLADLDLRLGDSQQLWEMTDDERDCRYCVFRSFCGRGVVAGQLDQVLVDDFELDDVSFDFADELEY